jgi:hypothetical protein
MRVTHGIRAALVGLVFAGPAVACLNDIELPAHEREFRSQYRGPAGPPPTPSAHPNDSPGQRLAMGGGVVLLAGAFIVALTGRRARS